MTAVQFLQDKGILPKNRDKWIVTFSGGVQMDIVGLLEEYHKAADAEGEPKEKKTSRRKSKKDSDSE